MLAIVIKYQISLNALSHNFNRSRDIIIHHGLMGSSKNFRNLSKSTSISRYCNSYLIDARNHGTSPHTTTHTIEDLADDLYEFIVENKLNSSGRKLTLMGHSMGGLALLEFTKRYTSPEIQKIVDRVIIIDIPATPIKHYDSFVKTGNMLKKMLEIDLKLPLAEINKQIDLRAVSQDVGALLKTNIIKNSQNTHSWSVNLQVLANIGYQNIGNYSLALNNDKKWEKPVELIYGELSSYYDAQQHRTYQQYYSSMPDQNFHCIKNAAHWVHFDQTQLFLQTMQKILKKDEQI